MITRQDVFLNLQKVDSKISVKVPDDISIHSVVLCIFILLFLLKTRDAKKLIEFVESHLESK